MQGSVGEVTWFSSDSNGLAFLLPCFGGRVWTTSRLLIGCLFRDLFLYLCLFF